MGLFYSQKLGSSLVGYADAGYLSDPHKAKSQTGYVFTRGGTAISWRSVKQTLTATSSNHSEIIAMHEASRECTWLRNMTHHIQASCGLASTKDSPTILYEDNAACIAQLKGGYIHTSFRRMVTLMFNKFAQVKIWLTYSQKHCRHPHSRNWCMRLGCVDSKIFSD
ncbi:Retrovirus-related Pol polyprotein from transposon TNT 1-94 [Abeliophyllum distichum]|uniref:Retrovirus-related Pol polyprotein from transposon TNT 1-94 n=1 Tax=Abeliophyllum distichum TaxID=126358 RepID=A0ABD1VTG4_9LAMI